MVKLDKKRVLDREVPFFYAKKMDICLCYVMDQAGIKHMEMPAHRLEDCTEYENMTIPKEAISFQGQKSDDVWVMMSKIDPQHMAEKMQEMIYDKDLYEIYVHNNTDEIIKFEDLHFNEYNDDTDTDEETESIPWYGTGYIYTTHHKSGNYLSMTPQDIKSELERYVIGQEEACKQTAIMMYQHLHGHRTVGLLAGPTGSGKSFITESLQKIFPDVVYLREISNLTRDGWSGQKKASTLFRGVKDPYGYGGKIHPLIVLDECDKCFSPNFSSTGECVSESVQSELLAAIHGADIEVKIDKDRTTTVDTRQMSFLFAGAFERCAENIAQKESGASIGFGAGHEKIHSYHRKLTMDDIHAAGCIKELCGRIQKIICLDKFKESQFRSMLDTVNIGPVHELENEFNVHLVLSDSKKDEMAHKAYKSGLGMRAIRNQIRNCIDEAIWNDCETQVIEVV